MITTHTLGTDGRALFHQTGDAVHLASLFGLPCGHFGEDTGLDRVRGVVVLDTDRGRIETHRMRGSVRETGPDAISLTWDTGDGLTLESVWAAPRDGILTRRDRLRLAASAAPLRVRRAMTRFVLAPGAWEAFLQESRWCQESQGIWRDTHGGVDIAAEGSRTCLGATPYLALRDRASRRGLAFNLVPRGNWKIRAQHVCSGFTTRPLALVVEMGHSDETLDWLVEPGGVLDLPEVVIQYLPTGEPERVTGELHGYLHTRPGPGDSERARFPEPPVVYNTWYDVFDKLDVGRMRRQLAAARTAGCDVFVIDAGWYGQGAGPWDQQVGDFREKLDGAFHGHMADFAREVRAAGLGFGLWVEPERLGREVPVVKAHPDWFAPAPSGFLYPRFVLPEAREYTYRMVAELIEKYELAWIKIDFNHELGYDPDGTEFARHVEGWYTVVDRLVAAYPRTFFEGCQSGALRKDLEAMAHWDAGFLSDNMNPFMSARIFEQEMLRYLPGRIGRWLCLRPSGGVAEYGKSADDSRRRIIVAGSATWDQAEVMDLDQAMKLVFPGVFGLSGDLAGLDPSNRDALARWVAIYKEWRAMIRRSVAWPLTAPALIDDRRGSTGLELLDPVTHRALVACTWLDLVPGKAVLYPRGLDPARAYGVRTLEGVKRRGTQTGQALMDRGLTVEFAGGQCAEVLVLE